MQTVALAARLFIERLQSRVRRARILLELGLRDRGPSVRRAIDVIASGLALVLAMPLFLFVAIAIKLTSRGPIFYCQERIGKSGRPFPLWKFRTMIVNADAMKTALATGRPESTDGIRFKLRKDPRITSVGSMLRKFSIDELPQLLNIFRGDMTLVGPRPPVRREVALYDPRALRRLEVVPGLTCLWQVRGRSELSFEEQVRLDIEYIDSVRPVQEIKILLQTVPAVLSGRGAY
jgi:lipopolysaccharide/colanic/teichoic acid biosynthesis glycosyltransferase